MGETTSVLWGAGVVVQERVTYCQIVLGSGQGSSSNGSGSGQMVIGTLGVVSGLLVQGAPGLAWFVCWNAAWCAFGCCKLSELATQLQ